MIGRWLNRTLQVWRPSTAPDGLGGQIVTRQQRDDVRAKVDQPSASERLLAAQAGSEHTHTVYLAPSADVARGDHLHGRGQVLRVLAVIEPSSTRYRRAECELVQSEGA
ncbi:MULTISPECIES: phage head closure protein [unclassified Streptomyces]|uniref:phage head closure protein n=1 Tax=unclassified Streptomyces TaxID=2593676 RepID=UPI00226ED9D2|nr:MULTISPECIES: phage head closure protein [unclassified Streptomyces]MCY0919608.1 phage head closure protein [Streptomyces sp. H27-G5]MCY0957210.1 phage head closure protein [Streptomyces sp. H27-H5]